MRLRPRKRFGQNFLHDDDIIRQIIDNINPVAGNCLLEIGPGTGALTNWLIDRHKILYAIEIDRDLALQLEEKFAPDLKIFNEDVLSFDFARIGCKNKIHLIGNLPYNISTPILFHILSARHLITDMVFMLQKEVVDRLIAAPNHKEYGRLSVMTQTVCEVVKILDVPPEAFHPQPKVSSAVVKFTVKPAMAQLDLIGFGQLIKISFAKRRKTLRNNLKAIINNENLTKSPLDLSRRAEQISITEYLTMFDWFKTL